MIFKYAVLSDDDLIGFLYLELPHRFKSIKGFNIDDWFPIKQIDVENDEIKKMQNFMARIKI